MENVRSGYMQSIRMQARRLTDGVMRPRSPREHANGQHKGTWEEGGIFRLDDGYVPNRQVNPAQKDFGTLRAELERKFGIQYHGIPHRNGEADFKSVSLAQIPAEDVIDRKLSGSFRPYYAPDADSDAVQTEHALADALGIQTDDDGHRETDFFMPEVFQTTFRQARGAAFSIADRLLAERLSAAQLAQYGLPQNCSGTDIAAWRRKNQLTWDESLENGYLLVPTLFHALHTHNGLVGVASHLKAEYQLRTAGGQFVAEDAAMISCRDLIAAIEAGTITELPDEQ